MGTWTPDPADLVCNGEIWCKGNLQLLVTKHNCYSSYIYKLSVCFTIWGCLGLLCLFLNLQPVTLSVKSPPLPVELLCLSHTTPQWAHSYSTDVSQDLLHQIVAQYVGKMECGVQIPPEWCAWRNQLQQQQEVIVQSEVKINFQYISTLILGITILSKCMGLTILLKHLPGNGDYMISSPPILLCMFLILLSSFFHSRVKSVYSCYCSHYGCCLPTGGIHCWSSVWCIDHCLHQQVEQD